MFYCVSTIFLLILLRIKILYLFPGGTVICYLIAILHFELYEQIRKKKKNTRNQEKVFIKM